MVGGSIEMSITVGEKSKKTQIQNFSNWDSIPKEKLDDKPSQLLTPTIGRECNPTISPNNQFIAFQYERIKIGIININGQGFKNICNDCMYPQWIDNNWVAYLKNNNQIFKKNKNAHKEQAITETGTFLDFQISPDNKWIAYTSSEVWDAQRKDSLEIPIVFASINGRARPRPLFIIDGWKTKKIYYKS